MDKMVLNTEDYSKVYIVGDLHGEITKLKKRLKEVNFNYSTDLLVSVGDLVDRGEDSLSCLELIYEDWFVCVKGNHEQMMIDSILDYNEAIINCWVNNGGMWYFHLTPEEREEVAISCKYLLDSCPYELLLEHKGKKILITHGDYPLDFYSPSTTMSPDNIIWNRSRIEDYTKHNHTQRIRDVDLAIFGHTPLKNVTRSGNCIWIDTGACFGKKLSLINLDKYLGV